MYSPLLNVGSGGFFLLPVAAPPGLAVPPGVFVPFASLAIPFGWLYCNGQAVSRVTYSALFVAIGTTWGGGDGVTTFNVPDMRGYFPRGFDDGAGVDPGRSFASLQQDQIQTHVHNVNVDHFFGQNYNLGGSFAFNNFGGGATSGPVTGNVGAETRPKNKAATFIIKT
jgi:microcystin-dependent protein